MKIEDYKTYLVIKQIHGSIFDIIINDKGVYKYFLTYGESTNYLFKWYGNKYSNSLKLGSN